MTAQGFLIYILEHFRDIKWDSMRDGDSIRNLIIQELRYFKLHVCKTGQFDTDKVVEAVKKGIKNERTTLHNYLLKIVNPKNSPVIRVNCFKEVARLHEGDSFGELALL